MSAAELKAEGNALFAKGDYEAAAVKFTAAIEVDSSDAVFFSNRSACRASMGDFKGAAEDGEQCTKLRPDWPRGYGRLGLARFKLGELEAAQKAYAQGLAHDPDNGALADGLAEVRAAVKKAGGKGRGGAGEDGDVGDVTVPGEAEPVIGIDLGTTYSCVAVWKDGQVEVLTNSEGERTTPSWVAFCDGGERLVGDPAKTQAARNAPRTLFNVKRLIGRQFSDCNEDVRRMPFTVKEGKGGRAVIEVDDVDGETKEFAPEQVSAMVLGKMRQTAEMGLGCDVTKAVITCPAYFNDAQRRLTKDAGTIAGLEVLRVINEPTAAALAYGLDKPEASKEEQHVLVFDLGGGTFDVSLLSIENGVFEVKATSGDTHLGGEDFDSALADRLMSDDKKRNKRDLFTGNAKAQRRLRQACEGAKRQLSSTMSARVEVNVADDELSVEVTRALFEKLCEPIFQRCLEAVKRVLTDSKTKKEDVDEIVLVGGSTRIPRVQQILTDFFGGKALCKSVHPDEAVAYGAAVQGAILSGVRDGAMSNVLLVDVIPLSLGVECDGRQFAKVVPRNTHVPCKKSSEFTTVEDYQTEIDVRIFEGERDHTDGNHLLGEFQITGVERARAGEAKVEVTFEVNTDGMLTVTARDKVTGAQANVEIEHDRGRLSPEEIAQYTAEAERMRAEDAERLHRM